MAFLENGSPVATKLGPIATLNTAIAGRAVATSIFEIANTTRFWLAMPQTTAGVYTMLTSTGTATIYVYDTSYDLVQEITVNTTSDNKTISSNFHRLEVVASTALDLSITPASSKTTAAGGTMVLETITGSGNWGVGSSNAAGSSGYAAGQYAHVVVCGPGGGGGGGSWINSPYGPYGAPGASGGLGGVAASTSAIALSGTYSLSMGTAGNGGAQGPGASPANNGNPASGSTTGFGLTANGGNGGNKGIWPNTPGTAGTAGSPSFPTDTDIFLGVTTGELGMSAGGGGGPGNTPPGAGSNGRIVILRWTP